MLLQHMYHLRMYHIEWVTVIRISSGMEANLAHFHISEVEWLDLRCWETTLRYDRPVDMIATAESTGKLILSS